MENLKIRVNSKAESKEAQELFFQLGGKWNFDGCKIRNTNEPYLYLENGLVHHGFLTETFNAEQHKEITLPELRAMVNPMKEYLEKQPDGTYALVLRGDLCKDDDIEVPDGMNYAYDAGSFIQFTKQEMGYRDSVLVWQREQDEPFLTPECTLNDQYAEQTIEQTLAERQSTYGNFEDVAFVTENIMSVLAKVRPDGLQDLPNAHRMALYMIASKMARIVNGDFNHLDSWHDIGGYSKLIEKLIKGE